VKDRVSNDIGAKETLKDWADINWKLVKKRIRNLRQRIYRATQNRQWNKVRSLMKLMLLSYSNLLLSVRKVTLENPGKKTAGIDNQKVLTPEGRVNLVKDAQRNREHPDFAKSKNIKLQTHHSSRHNEVATFEKHFQISTARLKF